MTLRACFWCFGAGACIGCAIARNDFGVGWAAASLFAIVVYELCRAWKVAR